jgi:hypothetical protein
MPLDARRDEQATQAMQTSAPSSVYLIVASPSLKRQPIHERLERHYTLDLPLFILDSPQERRLVA